MLKPPVFELGPSNGPLRIHNGIFERSFVSGRLVVDVNRWNFSSPAGGPLTLFDELKAPRPPNGWNLEASTVDKRFNEDLLRNTSTSSWAMVLGGPEVHGSDPNVPGEGFWFSRGVQFLRKDGYYRDLIVGSRTFVSSYGTRDYCVIYLGAGGRLYIAGVTRYGTRAGIMWVSDPDGWYYTTHLNMVVIEWVDRNGNGSVDPCEIHPVLAEPGGPDQNL